MNQKRLACLKKCADYVLNDQNEADSYLEWCECENKVDADWESNAGIHVYATAMTAMYSPKELQEIRIRDYSEEYLLKHGFLKPNSIELIKSLAKKEGRKIKK